MPETTGLPHFFTPLLQKHYEKAWVDCIINGSSTKRTVTLRANPLLSSAEEVAEILTDEGISWQTVPWYQNAFVLNDSREDHLWKLPLFTEGKIYLQNLSAMIPPLALGATPQSDVLDMCAAPGGKTTQIIAETAGKSYVTACEMHKPRAEKLEFNLRRQGASNVTIMQTDSRQLDDFFSFDFILLDAPCSGSGTLQTSNVKHSKHFTPALIDKSIKAQKQLFSKALKLLRPGATLVYSTCSVLKEENEFIVEEGLKKAKSDCFELVPIEFEGMESLPLLPTTIEGTLCLYPTELYEGFFIAKIKRNA